MDPRQVENYKDGENSYPVEVIVLDYNDMAIGRVVINNKRHFVVRWNYGLDESNIGFPQSHGHPTWMILAEGIKLIIEL